MLVHVVEEVSSTTAFVVGELGFEGFAIVRACSLVHSFERVVLFVSVDLEDDVLAVPPSEVVEFVDAAARDHLCWSV